MIYDVSEGKCESLSVVRSLLMRLEEIMFCFAILLNTDDNLSRDWNKRIEEQVKLDDMRMPW